MKCGVAVLFVAVVAFLGSDTAAQANPYKDPTPGASGYRAEVLAEARVQEDKFTVGGSDFAGELYVEAGGCAVDRAIVSARSGGESQFAETDWHAVTGGDRREQPGKIHHGQSQGGQHVEGFFRAPEGSDCKDTRCGLGQESGLVWRKEYGTRSPAVYHATPGGASGAIHCLCAIGRRDTAVDRRPAALTIATTKKNRATADTT